MIIAFSLFGLAVLLYILAASRRAPVAGTENSEEIAALIAHHDAHLADNPEERAAQEYHLYHAIAQLRNNAQHTHKLPIWIWAIVPVLLAAIAWLWYVQLGGHFAERWLELSRRLDPAVSRSLYLGDLPQNIDEQSMHTYCQTLQTRIDRQDPDQLDTLGQCYLQYGNHQNAADAYRQLRRVNPQDDHAALQYAQASLFANPDQAMSADVEAILTRLYHENRADTLTGILLATAYTRAGDTAHALPIWQQLQSDTNKNHPLYALIDSTATQMAGKTSESTPTKTENTPASDSAERRLTVIIPPTLLAKLPSGAQLFVSLAGKDNPMPLAVQKLDPQAEQHIIFRADNSMTGAPYLDRDDLVLRVFLSADGSVTGEKLGDIREDFPPNHEPTLTFPE